MTAQEAYEEYLDTKANKLSSSALNQYQIVIDNLLSYIIPPSKPVSEISREDISDYIDWIHDNDGDYSGGTIELHFNTLKGWITWMIEESHRPVPNPVKSLDIFKWKKVKKGGESTKKGEITKARGGVVYVTKTDVDKLCKHAPAPVIRNELAIRLAFSTGVRPIELTRIRKSDINFPWDEPEDPEEAEEYDPRRIKILTAKRPDRNVVRHVWYPKSLDRAFRNWLRDREATLKNNSPYLLVTNRDSTSEGTTGISPHSFNQMIRTAAENAGIQEDLYPDASGGSRQRVTAVALRHGYAVHSIRHGSGIDIRSLQLLLGHSKITTTEKYLQFRDSVLKSKALQYGPGQ